MDNRLEIILIDGGGRWKMQYGEESYGNAVELDDGIEPDENLLFELLVQNFVDSYREISGQPLSNIEDVQLAQKLTSLL